MERKRREWVDNGQLHWEYVYSAEEVMSELRRYNEKVDEWHKLADLRSAEIIRLTAENDRLQEELTKIKEAK